MAIDPPFVRMMSSGSAGYPSLLEINLATSSRTSRNPTTSV